MKKLCAVLLAFALIFTFAGCSNNGTSDNPPTGQDGSTERAKKAVYITQYGLSAPFTQMCWSGVDVLKNEGWEVKCLEVPETTEFADQIRAMAADGYSVIVTEFDALAEVAIQLSDELYEQYPNLQIFLNDTYVDSTGTKNCANIICDPWESSFVAGFVAANSTDKDVVGWIGHTNQESQDRFRYGYEAGVKYANNGKTAVVAYTGDSNDSNKGQETCKSLIAQYGVDVIYQAANTSGIGVIKECQAEGIKCIGVDMWQGGEYGQETVFWSALKPINNAITDCVKMAQEGKWTGHMYYYDVAHGATVFDERDFELLPADLQTKVTQLIADISSGKVDVYSGYEDYRYTPKQ